MLKIDRSLLIEKISSCQDRAIRTGIHFMSDWQDVVDLLGIDMKIKQSDNPIAVTSIVHAEIMKLMLRGEL